jgi:hypothetical protein
MMMMMMMKVMMTSYQQIKELKGKNLSLCPQASRRLPTPTQCRGRLPSASRSPDPSPEPSSSSPAGMATRNARASAVLRVGQPNRVGVPGSLDGRRARPTGCAAAARGLGIRAGQCPARL